MMCVRRMAALLALCCATGCAASFWMGNKSTTLRLGMTRQQAQAMLGPPQTVMRQEMRDAVVETWKYLDKTLTFHNGVLQTWVPVTPAAGVSVGVGTAPAVIPAP